MSSGGARRPRRGVRDSLRRHQCSGFRSSTRGGGWPRRPPASQAWRPCGLSSHALSSHALSSHTPDASGGRGRAGGWARAGGRVCLKRLSVGRLDRGDKQVEVLALHLAQVARRAQLVFCGSRRRPGQSASAVTHGRIVRHAPSARHPPAGGGTPSGSDGGSMARPAASAAAATRAAPHSPRCPWAGCTAQVDQTVVEHAHTLPLRHLHPEQLELRVCAREGTERRIAIGWRGRGDTASAPPPARRVVVAH